MIPLTQSDDPTDILFELDFVSTVGEKPLDCAETVGIWLAMVQ